MKYKNITRVPQKFRAFDTKMVKKVFDVKPGGEIETGVKIDWKGMELIKEQVGRVKTKKGKEV